MLAYTDKTSLVVQLDGGGNDLMPLTASMQSCLERGKHLEECCVDLQ